MVVFHKFLVSPIGICYKHIVFSHIYILCPSIVVTFFSRRTLSWRCKGGLMWNQGGPVMGSSSHLSCNTCFVTIILHSNLLLCSSLLVSWRMKFGVLVKYHLKLNDMRREHEPLSLCYFPYFASQFIMILLGTLLLGLFRALFRCTKESRGDCTKK